MNFNYVAKGIQTTDLNQDSPRQKSVSANYMFTCVSRNNLLIKLYLLQSVASNLYFSVDETFSICLLFLSFICSIPDYEPSTTCW